MRWLRALLVFFFAPSLARLEREASEVGRLILQQTALADGLGWSCSLRALEGRGGPRYSWTSTGATMQEAIADCLAQAKGYPIGGKPVVPHAPKLGGREYDE